MKTICIDFDGVLHDYSKGWQGVDVFSGAIDGASEGTHSLKEKVGLSLYLLQEMIHLH